MMMRVPLGFASKTLPKGAKGALVATVSMSFRPTRLVIGLTSRRSWFAGLLDRLRWLLFGVNRTPSVLIQSIRVAGEETLRGDVIHDIFAPTSVDCGLTFPSTKPGDEVVIEAMNHGSMPCTVFATMLGDAEVSG